MRKTGMFTVKSRWLGHNRLCNNTITKNIIKQGQADFDASHDSGNLPAEDIVKMYCYFNMRMHFFSSLSIFERSNIVEQYYNTSGKIKFIDIGCGPATSGLALMEHIHKTTETNVMFDYFGVDCSVKIQEKANEILTNDVFDLSNYKAFFDDVSQIDLQEFADNSCLIVNACYLFASHSLDLTGLATFINELRTIELGT